MVPVLDKFSTFSKRKSGIKLMTIEIQFKLNNIYRLISLRFLSNVNVCIHNGIIVLKITQLVSNHVLDVQ